MIYQIYSGSPLKITAPFWDVTAIALPPLQTLTCWHRRVFYIHTPSGAVAVLAAEALYNLGNEEVIARTFLRVLDDDNYYLKCFAMNTIDCLDLNEKIYRDKIAELAADFGNEPNRYDKRMVIRLLEKWGMDVPAQR